MYRPYNLTFVAAKRNSGSITRPEFTFTTRLWKLYKNQNFRMSCSVPSFQNITSSNNSSTIASTSFNITAGKYSSGELLASTIQTSIQAIASTYTCTYSQITEKFTIANSAGVFTMTTTSDDLLQFIGFTSSSYSGVATYTSDIVPLLYPVVVHLQSNLHGSIYRGIDRYEDLLSYVPDNTIYSVLVDNVTPLLTFDTNGLNILQVCEDGNLSLVWFEWRDSSNNVLTPSVDWVVQIHMF